MSRADDIMVSYTGSSIPIRSNQRNPRKRKRVRRIRIYIIYIIFPFSEGGLVKVRSFGRSSLYKSGRNCERKKKKNEKRTIEGKTTKNRRRSRLGNSILYKEAKKRILSESVRNHRSVNTSYVNTFIRKYLYP